MPNALRIFLGSLFWGVLGAVVTFRVGGWVIGRWFGSEQEQFMAFLVLTLLTLAVGVAAAVSAGVSAGRKAR